MARLSPQEEFWGGEFGDEYIRRNPIGKFLPGRLALFAKVLHRAPGITSVLELGANIGSNLVALKYLLPEANFSAVEINRKAAEALEGLGYVSVHNCSLFDFRPDRLYDLVFTSGVLIHLPPDRLQDAYSLLFNASDKYICIIEYYNPSPVEVPYRGHSERLFKRDFAGELMERFNGRVELLDYGFIYHGDRNFPMDDVTWFLMKKVERLER